MLSYNTKDKIGQFSIIDEISHGGMAEVFLVSRKGKSFALKVSRTSGRSDERGDSCNNAIRKEANLLKTIKHPRIVRVYPILTDGHIRRETVFFARDKKHDNEPWYFVMEYLRGGTVEDFIKKYGPLGISEATNIIGNIALGLNHLLEEHEITHNDVSLRNIVFRSKIAQGDLFDPVLIDFGSSASAKRFRDEAGAWFIMSPERIKIAIGEYPPEMITQIDPEKIDVWSLGIILYYALTKELPFSSLRKKKLTSEILNTPPEPIRTYNKDVPDKLEKFIIDGCLCKNYRSRSTIYEVLKELRPYGSGDVRAVSIGR